MCKWYEQTGECSDVVISSRVRLARNIRNYPFSTRLTDRQALEMNQEVMEKLADLKNASGSFTGHSVNRLDELSRLSMAERYLISPIMVEKQQETGVLLSPDEAASILVNEEDHLRIQSLSGAMNMKQALEQANEMDEYVQKRLDISYHKKYGYLTACPTNVGTGLRASYMVFLPALDGAGRVSQLINEVGKFGIAIRGMYGEGTKACASIYQISNQKTLGVTEEEIIEKLDSVVLQIIHQERKRREYILGSNYSAMEDQIYRSYGVLKYAKQINTKDALTLLSQLKFGVETKMIRLEGETSIFQMMMEIRPANLQKKYGKIVSSAQRDQKRAEYINKKLPEIQ